MSGGRAVALLGACDGGHGKVEGRRKARPSGHRFGSECAPDTEAPGSTGFGKAAT